MRSIAPILAALGFVVCAGLASAQDQPPPLRVESVTPARVQRGLDDKAVIFHDEFDQPPDKRGDYFEYTSEKGSFAWVAGQGLGGGGAMRAQFEKGQVTVGTLKVLFGKNPFGRGIRKDETFREIYWRVYAKHEAGWEGNPAKFVRATCLASRDWTQGFIAHVWGGRDDCLCIDPATGIVDSQIVTTKYNDFARLKWLGMRNGKTPIFSTAESGRWVCVESHVKLNTPGKKDGVFELCVDGKPEASHDDLDWQGTWNDYAIDAVFLENYWNDGSVKRQARWFDGFVISTQPIGPAVAALPVTINRTRAGEAIPWEAEVASGPDGKDIVWQSHAINAAAASVTVDEKGGQYTKHPGSDVPRTELETITYWVRVRRIGGQDWSPWHAPFRVVNPNGDFTPDSPGQNYPGSKFSVTDAIKKSDFIVIARLDYNMVGTGGPEGDAIPGDVFLGGPGESMISGKVTVERVFKGKTEVKKQLPVWIERLYSPGHEGLPKAGRSFLFFIKPSGQDDSRMAVVKMLPVNEETINSVTQPSN